MSKEPARAHQDAEVEGWVRVEPRVHVVCEHLAKKKRVFFSERVCMCGDDELWIV